MIDHNRFPICMRIIVPIDEMKNAIRLATNIAEYAIDQFGEDNYKFGCETQGDNFVLEFYFRNDEDAILVKLKFA